MTASRMSARPRIVPIDTTGLLGAISTTSAAAIASTTPGAGSASSRPTWTKPRARQRRAVLDPPLLEVDRLPGAVQVDDDVRLAAVVGHRQQPTPGCHRSHRAAMTSVQRVAGVEHPGADQVGGEVEIAQLEPGRLGAVGVQLVLHPPRLAGASPAAVVVVHLAEGVHAAVEVRGRCAARAA